MLMNITPLPTAPNSAKASSALVLFAHACCCSSVSDFQLAKARIIPDWLHSATAQLSKLLSSEDCNWIDNVPSIFRVPINKLAAVSISPNRRLIDSGYSLCAVIVA